MANNKRGRSVEKGIKDIAGGRINNHPKTYTVNLPESKAVNNSEEP